MDDRYNKGLSASINRYTNSLRSFLSGTTNLSELTRTKRALTKYVTIPIAVVSSTFLTSITDKAYAEATAPTGVLQAQQSSWWNPLAPIGVWWDKIVAWFQELPHNIAGWSIELMAKLYELCSTLILKTPTWIFDNDWFQNTTYQFSLFSIGIVSILTAVEAIKQMLSRFRKGRRAMEFKTIMRRWFLVSGVITAVPYLFLKGFQLLNFVSGKLISMGGDTMRALTVPENIHLFDVATLVIFDIILIATIIPVLWKNGRRFFDIMVLGIVSPFALSAWIFDSYKHLHKQWWDNLKQLSLVQIYYAIFLLVLGWFIFGVPTPSDVSGMIIKLLVVIGGFARMVNPPRIVTNHLDKGGGFDEVYGGVGETIKGVRDNWTKTKQIVSGPRGWATMAWRRINPAPKAVSTATGTMSRVARRRKK